MGMAGFSKRAQPPLNAALMSMNASQRDRACFCEQRDVWNGFDYCSDSVIGSAESLVAAGVSGVGAAAGMAAKFRLDAISRMRLRSVSPMSAKTLVKVSRSLSSAPAVTRATESRDWWSNELTVASIH